MVLLHAAAQQSNEDVQLIVAHVDHGIRPDSGRDAELVRQAAKELGLRYEQKTSALGETTSEETARRVRYDFLWELAQRYDARIVTAHHADDVVETIAINLIRGTGWRGLAGLRSDRISRPFLAYLKVDIIEYARENHLHWHEDSTNTNSKYLRNTVRHQLRAFSAESKRQILELHGRQTILKQRIEAEATRLVSATKVGSSEYQRHLFIMADTPTAMELLRSVTLGEFGYSFTRPQLLRALQAIKVFRSGTTFELGATAQLVFTTATFIVRRS